MSDEKCKICGITGKIVYQSEVVIDWVVCDKCQKEYKTEKYKLQDFINYKLISRIEKLEYINNQLLDKFSTIFLRLEKLEEDREQFNRIESLFDSMGVAIGGVSARVKKLENFMPDVLTDLEGRIIKLEQKESK